jgi:hypothetical protein
MKGLAYLYRLNAQPSGAAPKGSAVRPAEKGANAAHSHRRPNRSRRSGRPRAAHREDEGTKSA